MTLVPEGVQTIRGYPFMVGNLAVDVYGKPINWKYVIQNLQDRNEAQKINERAYALGKIGAKKLICPIPEHGNKLTSSKEIRILTVSEGEMAIFKRERADGSLVEPGEACAYASGDCPTVGLHDPLTRKTVVLHASRKTLLDQVIVKKAIAHFSNSMIPRMIATISLGIDPNNFLHSWHDPKYGESNQARTLELITEYGEEAVSEDEMLGGINLHYIVALQLIRAGLEPTNIFSDTIDTFSDPKYWSQRASTTDGSPKYGEEGRNLVLIANLS